ncbi:MAG: YqgE/AlgH family protein [Alphaproteobacteria bacterium]
MDRLHAQSGYMNGQLLIAMPAMRDPRFAKSVIYMCVHNAEGAMGLVVNRLVDSLTFADLIDQLNIETLGVSRDIPVHYGGPVETGRGFVLHSAEYRRHGTIMVTPETGLTATVDILKDMAEGRGPRHALLALGYAGWGPGQLDGEIQQNAWLHVPADEALVFDRDLDSKWERSIAKIGVDLRLLSGDAGHA